MWLYHTENIKIIVLRFTTIPIKLCMQSVISTSMEYFADSGFIRRVGTDPANYIKSQLRRLRA